MCGIMAVLDLKGNSEKMRELSLKHVKRLRHRGPDWSGIYSDESALLLHERLSIVDVEHGAQPLYDLNNKRVLAVNGEIYNHVDLKQTLKKDHKFQTNSDCEPILYLYDEHGPEFIHQLSGIFAFVLYDQTTHEYYIARDHIGIIPLYWGRDSQGNHLVASELNAIFDLCDTVEEFPP